MVLRCPFLVGFALTGCFSLSLPVGDGGFDDDLLLLAPVLSISNTALRKSGSPKSSVSSFRKPAAPSRNAWLVFSMAFLSPMSDLETQAMQKRLLSSTSNAAKPPQQIARFDSPYQRPVTGFFSRKRPGGFSDLTASTIDRLMDIFCRFVLVT